MDDPEHAKLRRITIAHLRQTKIKQWQDIIDATVTTLLDDAERQDGVFDLVEVVAARLPMLVLAQVLGVPAEDAPKMVDWTNRLTSSDPDEIVDEAALAQARDEVMAYFEQLTEQRRREPAADLVSILANGEKDGVPLSWEELAAYYIVLVAAGNETTRQLVSGGAIALQETAGAWDRLEAAPSLLDSAIEEMLRFVSPVSGLRRTATKDIVIGGKQIRTGDKVVLWFSAANRDPEVFEAPNEFRIDRTPNDHLTFGWGVHFCLGAHLARAEGKAFFAEVLRRGIRFELAGDPKRVPINIFRAWSEVPVRIVRAGSRA
jgi:cholest-4-en-3-one 26-monooxygenase